MSKDTDDQNQKAQIEAALQEPMIDALHEDARIDAFLYNGETPDESMIEDVQFQKRATCIIAALEIAVARMDLSGIFADMAACAKAVDMDADVPQDALNAVKEHAEAYLDGKFKPTVN